MPTVTESSESTGRVSSFGGASDSQTRIEIVEFASTEVNIAVDKIAEAYSSFELGTPDIRNTDLFCQTINTERDSDNPLVFRVTATFVSNQFDVPDTSGNQAVVQDWNLSAQAKPKLVYRLPQTTDKPESGNPTDADIKGTPVDRKGQKVSIVDINPTVSVTVRREVSIDKPGNYIEGVLQAVGSRNRKQFLGAASGKLLLTGLSTRRVTTNESTKTYDVTFTFVFDDEFHMEQVAESTSERQSGVKLGKDDTNNNCPTGTPGQENYCEHAFKVKYVQPFTTLANFGALGIDIR